MKLSCTLAGHIKILKTVDCLTNQHTNYKKSDFFTMTTKNRKLNRELFKKQQQQIKRKLLTYYYWKWKQKLCKFN